MLKKLTRVGNSLALVIDDPILEHLGDAGPARHPLTLAEIARKKA